MNRLMFLALCCFCCATAKAQNETSISEIDLYWQEIAKSVRNGDAAGYRSLYHNEAVVVMQKSGKTFLIDDMMKQWNPGFEATAAGKMKANVEIRWTKRIVNEKTAWSAGVFHYWSTDEADKDAEEYVVFESLMVKKDGKWLQTMELQKEGVTRQDWQILENK